MKDLPGVSLIAKEIGIDCMKITMKLTKKLPTPISEQQEAVKYIFASIYPNQKMKKHLEKMWDSMLTDTEHTATNIGDEKSKRKLRQTLLRSTHHE